MKKYVVPIEDKRSIPLFGLFGVMGYTPNFVVRQLGDEQDVRNMTLRTNTLGSTQGVKRTRLSHRFSCGKNVH